MFSHSVRPEPCRLPPAQNCRRTQITTTLPTYRKAADLLDGVRGLSSTLGGEGLGAALHGWDSLKPYPPPNSQPTARGSREIAPRTYADIVCLNVLDVHDPLTRVAVVRDILRILRPGGEAVIMTRGRDVEVAVGVMMPPSP